MPRPSRRVLQTVLLLASGLLVLATFVTLLPIDWWGVRALDFPRLQIFALCLLALGLTALAHGNRWTWLPLVVMALTLAATAYQGARILPYTRFWPRQVKPATQAGPELRLLIANVLMDNRAASRLLAQIRESDADVVVLTEPDAWWNAQLAPLHGAYPHRVEVPLANTYGMIVLSRLPLIAPQVKYLIEPDIPSVHTAVRLGDTEVALRFLHPKPPAPGEAETSEPRDAELVVIGREVDRLEGPAIVAGDLNDVAWSRSTRLFQRISGTLDPRRGRGLYSTFHADYPFLRWPLDHLFHTEHFTLLDLRRLGKNGSDHFPILVALRLTPDAARTQKPPAPEPDDQEDAQKQIEEGQHEGVGAQRAED